jgi:hypothetical protein
VALFLKACQNFLAEKKQHWRQPFFYPTRAACQRTCGLQASVIEYLAQQYADTKKTLLRLLDRKHGQRSQFRLNESKQRKALGKIAWAAIFH